MSGRMLIACSLVLATAHGAASDEGSPRSEGAAAFAEGKKLLDAGKDARSAFLRAMRAYQKTEGSAPGGASKAQNLGNAAFLADDLPLAILAYRYGLFHDRHHAVMRENLAYARSQVRYPHAGNNGRPRPDPWPSWMPRLRTAWFVGIGAASYFLGWLALAGSLWRRDYRLVFGSIASFAVAACAAYGCVVLRAQQTLDIDLPPVVIRMDDVPLRTGNGVSYPRHAELPTLFRGMEARQRNVRGEWRQIQFDSGEIGWVPARATLTWSDLWQ